MNDHNEDYTDTENFTEDIKFMLVGVGFITFFAMLFVVHFPNAVLPYFMQDSNYLIKVFGL